MTNTTDKARENTEGSRAEAGRSGKAAATPPAPRKRTVAPADCKRPAAPMANEKPARRSATIDETVEQHRKVLAEALELAQAIQYDPPPRLKPAKAERPAKAEKPAKMRKTKLVRDSYAMPEAEYAQIGELKKRLGGAFKKSELLRAGVAVLSALDDAELRAVMGRIERIQTGRPAKR